MKKVLSVLLALMMLAACGTVFAEQEARKIETPADAEEWIRVFLGEHPEELDGAWAMTAQMQAAADQMISPAYMKEIQGFQAFFVPCKFAAAAIDLVLYVQDGAIAGVQTGVYSGKEEENESEDRISKELNLPVPAMDGELPGILTLPTGDGPFPAVVLVHGSGPNDMDETIGNVKPFRDLAEGLAAKGVAVYRYDKRTYTLGMKMAENHQGTLMEETVDDAVAAVQLLAQQDQIDASRIYVLGHSLGGNAIPMIDKMLKEQPASACGYVICGKRAPTWKRSVRTETLPAASTQAASR